MQQRWLKCFGVSDGWASTGRNHSAFLYHLDDACFLIDAGEPVGRSFHESGISYDAPARILLSHLHFDHLGGLFMLLQGFWLHPRRRDLPISLPRDGIAPIRQMLNVACIYDELLSFRLHFEPLQAGEPIQIGSARVTPHLTTHLDGFRHRFSARYPQDFAAYSFLIESGRQRIAHSADIGSPEDLDPLLAEPVDLLVCELAHFKPEDLFRYLASRSIRRILFIHLARPHWERLDQLRLTAAARLPEPEIIFAHDGQLIAL